MEQKSEIEVFRQHLKGNGLRFTPEREQILREIFRTHDHFDVETIYLRMVQNGDSISKASIYRLIPLLLECKLLDEVFFEDGHMHYEHIYGHDHHCHLRCYKCRKIEEFSDHRLHEIEQNLAEKFGYKIISHKLDVQGLCRDCQEKS